MVYLDDGLCAVAGRQALEASQLVRSTLDKAGFIAHPHARAERVWSTLSSSRGMQLA